MRCVVFALIATCAGLAGCSSPSLQQTREHRPNTQDLTYDRFVEKRTEELQRMGGPYAERFAAEEKARKEADLRFGNRPRDYTKSRPTKAAEQRAAQEAEIEGTLKEMEREKASPAAP